MTRIVATMPATHRRTHAGLVVDHPAHFAPAKGNRATKPSNDQCGNIGRTQETARKNAIGTTARQTSNRSMPATERKCLKRWNNIPTSKSHVHGNKYTTGPSNVDNKPANRNSIPRARLPWKTKDSHSCWAFQINTGAKPSEP